MALNVCLPELLKTKAISQATHDRMKPAYDELVAQLEPVHGRAAAESMATGKVLDQMELDLVHRQRQALLTAQKQGAWLKRRELDALPSGSFNATKAHDDLVDMDHHRNAVRSQAYAMIDGLLAKHRRNIMGEVRAKADLDAVVDELHGQASGDPAAREIADAWQRTAEWLRSRYNAAGGRIAKLDTWTLPQTHDARAVGDAGFERWRDTLVPLLDREKMLDYQTGLPMADGKLEVMLRDMWEAISTDGWSRANAGGVQAGSLGNARQQHRVLHFAGPDAWRAYSDEFGGSATAFDAMLAHVERMARDIAAMERLGPNPVATIRWQGDWLEKRANEALDRKSIDKVYGARRTLERLYGEYSGGTHRPESRRLALAFSIFRAQQTAAKLGGALLSSGGDFGTMLLTAHFDGIPAMKVLQRYGTLFNPRNLEDRAMAARLGLVSSEWTNAAAAQWRYSGEEMSHEISRRVAEGVLRASGLATHTEAAQMAFGLELLASLVHHRRHDFSQLNPAMARMLERNGVGRARWDVLRATPVREQRGSDWFFPEDMAAHGGDGLADDVLRMISTEVQHAVPSLDLRTRTQINSMLPRATWLGEVGRTMLLFKGYPLSILNLHGRRMLEQTGGARWKYGLTMAAMTTVGGALSLQLKELAKGRDPQDMTTARFLGAAAMQGGGLGIFGDLLGSSTDRFGGGLGRTLLGPGAQTLGNVTSLFGANAKAMLDGDPETETAFARDLAKTVQPEVPGLSLWYLRGFYDRTMGDMIGQWTDPNHGDTIMRALRKAEEQDTAYYAPPGMMTGEGGALRAPDWGNAIGQPAQQPEAGM
jgi:hypothetical protein